jgi:glycine reductase
VAQKVKGIYYVNQFFGQIGGEQEANTPLKFTQDMVGPGNLLQELLKDYVDFVGTIICGDNYFTEHIQDVAVEIAALLKQYDVKVAVAGPAFNAGRYGIACGEFCKIADSLGIKAFSGMYEGNPAVDIYKKHCYIVPTKMSAQGMQEGLSAISRLVIKYCKGKEFGLPEEEGYFPQGYRKNVFVEKNGAKRAVEMILAKVKGEPFATELPIPHFSKVTPSPPVKDMKKAKIVLMTTGGIVPKGNPDKIESCFATKFARYNIKEMGKLTALNYESVHGGYDTKYANEDPNCVLPVDVMLEMEADNTIGKLHEFAYVTVGNGMSVEMAKNIGKAIALELKDMGDVDGVILTST